MSKEAPQDSQGHLWHPPLSLSLSLPLSVSLSLSVPSAPGACSFCRAYLGDLEPSELHSELEPVVGVRGDLERHLDLAALLHEAGDAVDVLGRDGRQHLLGGVHVAAQHEGLELDQAQQQRVGDDRVLLVDEEQAALACHVAQQEHRPVQVVHCRHLQQ